MKKNKSVILEWGISYIVILLIPVFIFFVNYSYSVKAIKKEIFYSNELVLNNLADNIDTYLYEQRAFYAFIVTNSYFDLLMTHDEKDAFFYYDASKMMEQIKNYSGWRTDMNSLIYFAEEDYVIGKAGNSSYSYYATQKKSVRENIDYLQWMEWMGAEYQNEFLIGRFMDGETDEVCVVYADSLYKRGYGKANIFISLSVSELEKLAESLEPGSKLVISNDDNPLLAISSKGVDELPENEDYVTKEGEMFETNGYMVIKKLSSEKNVVYYLLIPERDFWNEFQHIRNLYFACLMLTLFVGIICVYVLVKRNYQPLYGLCEKISNNAEKQNEFQLIENVYNKLIAEKCMLQKKVATGEEALQGYYLLSLMKGRALCLQNEMKEAPIYLKPDERVVLIGLLVPLSDGIVFFVVDNIFSELMEKERFYRIEDGKYLLYLLHVSENTDWKERCLEKIRYLCDVVEEKWEIVLHAAVSESESEIERISYLYQAVTEALEYKSINGEKGIIDIFEWQSTKKIVNEIIKYVEIHYVESDLNINSVADGINRNAKYISKVFRDETGEGILDYIHGLRIQKAQFLMRSSKFTLEEISEKVGYSSTMTFRRAFVKIVGVTPGKYREDL